MEKEENVEIFYDIINEAVTFLFETIHTSYLESLFHVTDDLLFEKYELEFKDKKDEDKYKRILGKMKKVTFDTESVRKGMQYLLMTAFKETRRVNNVTPDTLGYLFAYLEKKIFKTESIALCDIALGTGNLLFTLANELKNPILYGIDIDPLMTRIAKMVANMMDMEFSCYLGNTLESHFANLDLIIGDLDGYMDNKVYFPYEAIMYHKDSLKENGFMFLLLPNDFFSYDTGFFKKAIEADLQMFGLLELPDSMFKGTKKSIFILQHTKKKRENFLMVKIPDFNNQELMNNTIIKLEEWFKGENL